MSKGLLLVTCPRMFRVAANRLMKDMSCTVAQGLTESL